MFASLNTMRFRTIKRYKLKTFELSQTYPLFFDKLEKSNWFFENILDTLDEPLSGRLVAHLLADPIGDGGQWDMFKSLVKKYGVIPKESMPETACSKNTREMDSYLTRYLRAAAKRLRETAAAGADEDDLLSMKKEMMRDVYTLLTTCLGEPPKSFDVRLRDKDDKVALSGHFTPREFFDKAVGMELDDYVSLISAPTSDKPFGRSFTVSRLGKTIYSLYKDNLIPASFVCDIYTFSWWEQKDRLSSFWINTLSASKLRPVCSLQQRRLKISSPIRAIYRQSPQLAS